MRRAGAGAVLAVVAVLLTGLQPASPAQARPVYPSADDVQRAKRHAAQALTDVKQIQAALDASAARVEAADLTLSQAAEDYDAAKVELENARRAAAVATAAARRAGQRLDGAERQVGLLASQAYRGGGPIASLDVLLSPAGPDQVLERATMMRTVAAGQQRTVHRMDEARVVATTLDRQATHAVQVQNAAAQRLRAAQQAAQRKADAARAALAEQNAVRNVLVTKLAKARRTTIAVEQARQHGLAVEAQRRREEAQREAERRAAAERANSGSGGSGNGSSDSRPAPDPGGSSSGTAGGGAVAVGWARRQAGLPYRWAADGPDSYDCSGLTMKAWAQAGVSLPHSSRMQYGQTEHVSYAFLRKGDLIFYATDPSNPSTIHHVTIYAGGGMMVEAPYTGAYVRVVPVRRSDSMPYAGRP
jgi:cell wall-associated NlpC family hydrolase